MFNQIFFVVLVLNATGLFRFVAPQVGVDIVVMSIMLLALHVAYVLANGRYLWSVLSGTDMKYWLMLLFAWPLATTLYAPSLELREIGLQAYYATLFCSAVVYALVNGMAAMHRVIGASLALSVFGLVLSMVAPGYFEGVAHLIDSHHQYHERAFGFFMQPNVAALGLIYLFVGWYAQWRKKGSVWDVAAMAALLAMTLATGSRTGVIVAVLVCALIVLRVWINGLAEGVGGFVGIYLKTVIFVAVLAAGIVWLNEYAAARASDRNSLYDRIRLLASFRLTEAGVRDGSARERLDAQEVYWSLIRDKPLLGHGLGSDLFFLESGKVQLFSHSDLLTGWMQYGIFYPLTFAMLMVRMCRARQRQFAERDFGTNAVLQFVCITICWFVINGNLLNARGFYVVWGLFFAAIVRADWALAGQRSRASGTEAWVGERPARASDSLPHEETRATRLASPRTGGCA